MLTFPEINVTMQNGLIISIFQNILQDVLKHDFFFLQLRLN